MPEIVDLDIATLEPIKVRMAGQEYLVPADIPVPLYLKITSFAGREDLSNEEVVRELYPELLALFQVHQPDLEDLPIGLAACIGAVQRIYGGGQEDAAEADPPKAGTKSTRGKAKKKRSASSGS